MIGMKAPIWIAMTRREGKRVAIGWPNHPGQRGGKTSPRSFESCGVPKVPHEPKA